MNNYECSNRKRNTEKLLFEEVYPSSRFGFKGKNSVVSVSPSVR